MFKSKHLVSALLLLFFLPCKLFAWNALGHRLIAQIAYDHMTETARARFDHYNQAIDENNFVEAAPWLDSLRSKDYAWLKTFHYIDVPYSSDGTKVRGPHKRNALFALDQALQILEDPEASSFEKGFSLRILIHVLGDLHQPMHTVSRFSKKFPRGDMGGNLWHLRKNGVASNLHAYWDNGGGLFKASKKNRHSLDYLLSLKQKILAQHPCYLQEMHWDPKALTQESYHIAVPEAYKIRRNTKPNRQYQQMVQKLSEERVALAGCRLASLLNSLEDKMKAASPNVQSLSQLD